MKEISKGCRKVVYNYSNQRANGNDMEDIKCGDRIFNYPELCEACEGKENDIK